MIDRFLVLVTALMGGPKAPHGRFISKSERAMAMTVFKGILHFQIKGIQIISAPPNNKMFIQIINTRILRTEKFSRLYGACT
jgi:hypothetical protein